MSEKNYVAGLDAGTSKICCVVADATDLTQPRIVGLGMSERTGIRGGAVIDLEEAAAGIREAVAKASRRAGDIVIDSVTAGIGGEHLKSLNGTATMAITAAKDEVTRKDINRVFEASKSLALQNDRVIIRAVPRAFTVDGLEGVKSPLGMYAKRLDVETHIITASVAAANNILKAAEMAGVAVNGCVPVPSASAENVLTDHERERGVILLDVGAGTTDVCVYHRGEPRYTASLALAGSTVTDDIAIVLKMGTEEAEEAKKESLPVDAPIFDYYEMTPENESQRVAVQKGLISSIIKARMIEIFEMIRDDIGKETNFDDIGAGVVLTGGGARVACAEEYAEKVFGMPVRMGVPAAEGVLADAVAEPEYSAAVGLIECGIKSLRDEYNNDAFRKVRGAKDKFYEWMRKIFRPGSRI